MSEPNNSDGEDYVVEKIVKKRIRNGFVEYFIKWEGYSDEHNTWEPEGNLECFELIEEFENKLEESSKSRAAKNPPIPSTSKEHQDDLLIYSKLKLANEQVPNNIKINDDTNNTKNKTSKIAVVDDLPIKKGNGFQSGLIPDKILGASIVSGGVMLVMRWKNGHLELVSAKDARKYCPHILIDFYEDHLMWED